MKSSTSYSSSSSKVKKKKTNNAKFLVILFDMVHSSECQEAIGFSEGGNLLEIRNLKLLETLLPKYFKHSNLSSFTRQLNNYGFRSVGSLAAGKYHHFEHEHFQKDRRDLLDLIPRKSQGSSNITTAAAAAAAISATNFDTSSVLGGDDAYEQETLLFKSLLVEKEKLDEENMRIFQENKKLKMILSHLEQRRMSQQEAISSDVGLIRFPPLHQQTTPSPPPLFVGMMNNNNKPTPSPPSLDQNSTSIQQQQQQQSFHLDNYIGPRRSSSHQHRRESVHMNNNNNTNTREDASAVALTFLQDPPFLEALSSSDNPTVPHFDVTGSSLFQDITSSPPPSSSHHSSRQEEIPIEQQHRSKIDNSILEKYNLQDFLASGSFEMDPDGRIKFTVYI